MKIGDIVKTGTGRGTIVQVWAIDTHTYAIRCSDGNWYHDYELRPITQSPKSGEMTSQAQGVVASQET